MKTVYISHPIKGLSENIISKLEERGSRWASENGMRALRPRNIQPYCRQAYGEQCTPDGSAGDGAGHTHACFMRGDLIALLQQADTILMMPGWEASVGCRAELAVALAAGITVHICDQDLAL